MTHVFDAYKPLRNHLREVSLIPSLGVVRAYLQHLQFGESFPSDMEVPREFLAAKHHVEKKVYEWELEVIAREIIINSPVSSTILLPKDLRRWTHFSGAINKLKDLENEIAKIYTTTSNVLLELYRIAHREFPWQSRPNLIWLTRYYKIFSYLELNSILHRVTGLTAKELYTLGLALSGFYLKKFALDYPPIIDIADIKPESFDLLLKRFAKDFPRIKELMIEAQQLDQNYVYSFNPMRMYPLIRIEMDGKQRLICPIPTFLFWRFTGGIYYELCKEGDFGVPFGKSFQRYIGEAISRAIVNHKTLSLHPEESYMLGKDRKDTVDWIVHSTTAALFVEAKAKRLRTEAKIDVVTQTVLHEELDKMADFITQVYLAIKDYRNSLYPSFPYDPNRTIFPLVLTLEEWYLFGKPLEDELNRKVLMKFEERGLDKNLLNEMPYSICSIEEFEKAIQIMTRIGLKTFMNKKVLDREKRTWPFASFMTREFPREYAEVSDLFPETVREINPEIR